MNEIAKSNPRAIDQTQGQRAKPPSAVLQPNLGPHFACRRFEAALCDFLQATGDLRALNGRGGTISRARRAAHALPTDAELDRLRSGLVEAAEGQATRAQIGAITAAFLDALPSFNAAKAPGYLDCLLFTLEAEIQVEPFSAQALAGAAFRLLRSEIFAPPPDKIIEAVREEQRRYRANASVCRLTLDGLAEFRTIGGQDD